jgi:UDP-N-acetylmuramoyl-tripeptide--D-alanyl-D-alanine ligase
MRASQVATAVGGRLVGDDVLVGGARHDSREVRGGELFVPVAAERDGHDFIGAAVEAGAVAYLTSQDPVAGLAAAAVVVDDPSRALRRLATQVRADTDVRLVGITGSVGKTSTKDLAASVLRRRYVTGASERSFNNELGVPLTIVNAPDDAEALVVEMGMRGFGHIASLCEVAQPQIGVVTRVARVHTELVGGLEGVARAKGELIEALPADGFAVLNVDDERVAAMASLTSAEVVTCGRAGQVRAEDVALDDELRAHFFLRSDWGGIEVEVGLAGEHQVGNALLAAAVGLVAGVSLEDVAAGLAEASGSPWRMDLVRTPSGAAVLNDAYNAGPDSMAAALRALVRLPARRHVAAVGTMAELGDLHDEAHREVAELAASLGVELIVVGEAAYGVPVVPDLDAALEVLGEPGPEVAVLVKASRVAGLERLVARLVGPG